MKKIKLSKPNNKIEKYNMITMNMISLLGNFGECDGVYIECGDGDFEKCDGGYDKCNGAYEKC